MKTEFKVDEVERLPDGVLARGAVNQGVLRVADVFSAAYKLIFHAGPQSGDSIVERSQARSIQLSVVSIVAYRHSLDELHRGMTGELKLSGPGVDIVKTGDLLET